MIEDVASVHVAELRHVSHAYGKTVALDDVSLDVEKGRIIGFIGPDGVGKSTLFSIVAGARAIQQGSVMVLGGDMRRSSHRNRVCPTIAYMPQGLGRNLYATLSVFENADFFGSLFGMDKDERQQRIRALFRWTGLSAFEDRPAGKLSGGMKQKLGLCCALLHDPDILILDEPTTGVDPLSRRQFWSLIEEIRSDRPDMSVLVATAYMEEAAQFDRLVVMAAGRVLATGSVSDILSATRTETLDEAFIALMPDAEQGTVHRVLAPAPLALDDNGFAIEAENLTMRFGDFTAVDNVSFRIRRGEIFGFIGSNGCGKTTTMKMLTGLLPADAGSAKLFGRQIDARDMETRGRVGYMSQAFSLYAELTVRQNLDLHARLFRLPPETIEQRIGEVADRFDLKGVMDEFPDALPLGVRQRLSLAVALVHAPEILILDEPTSGVDPLARDAFGEMLIELSRKDGVTIFISTHFMNEADRCDRIALMHAGKVLASDTPAAIRTAHQAPTLEAAFVACLEAANGEPAVTATDKPVGEPATRNAKRRNPFFDVRRALSYSRREMLELRRDPIRAALALVGSVILMFVFGYGINLDVKNMTFAVLDRDQTAISRDYIASIAGSTYFIEKAPISSYADLDERMRSGALKLAIEIPTGFASQVEHGRDVAIGAWIDGSMPQTAETIRGYVQGMHAHWVTQRARTLYGDAVNSAFNIETRYLYNPSTESLIAMVPAVIPLLLLLIPAILSTLSVVREKDLGSIVNFYVTPVTRLEFLLGKQAPYLALGLANAALLWLFAVAAFRVPFTGSLAAFGVAAFLYVAFSTAFGLFMSTFLSSQIAAIFGTTLMTIIPAVQFSGMIDPVSSLQGFGAMIGEAYPTTYFNIIARGTFSKGLSFDNLFNTLLPLVVAGPLFIGASAFFLKKQAR